MVAHLRRAKPWLEVIHGDAVELGALLAAAGVTRVDAVVSTLPWSLFPGPRQSRILHEIGRVLAPGAAFTTVTYLYAMPLPRSRAFRRRLRSAFEEVLTTGPVWRNLPAWNDVRVPAAGARCLSCWAALHRRWCCVVGWLLIVAEAGLLIGVLPAGDERARGPRLSLTSRRGAAGRDDRGGRLRGDRRTQLSFLMGRRRTLGKRRTLGRRRALGKRPVLGKRPGLGKRRDALAGFWEHGRRLLVRRGVWAVLAGQWLGSARTLVPRLAGWSGMSYRAFACASLPSAAAWAATLVSLSRFLAPDIIHHITGHLAPAGPSVVALLLLVFWLRHRRRAPADDVAGHRRQRVAVSGADRPSRGRAGEGAGR